MKKMNNKGNFLLIIGVALGFILLASISLPVIMKIFPAADIIVRIMLIFVIFTMVRGYLGNGTMSLIISGILIYLLVFKWWWLSSSVWFFTILMSFGLVSVFVWGTSKIIPQH